MSEQKYEVFIGTVKIYKNNTDDNIECTFKSDWFLAECEQDAAEKAIASLSKTQLYRKIVIYGMYRQFANKLSRLFFKVSKSREIIVVTQQDTDGYLYRKSCWFYSNSQPWKYEWASSMSWGWYE